jgi:PPM family protein phosphatase
MTLQIASATDVGLRREHNEDFHASWSPADAGELAQRGELLVIADGMGGSAAGEIASHTAVDAVIHHYRDPELSAELALQRALEAAHRAVYRMGREHPEWSGMGTTCTAIAVRGSEVRYAHVGDSRAYLVRDGWIIQLTTDHSLVQQMVVQQLMTPEQARVDPRRNVLTRSVGVGEAIEVDAGVMAGGLLPGDTLMLCSDGLHGLVSDPELGAIARQPDLERACAELVELARTRGGHDNITVMLARLAV